jgi:two-component system sensor histidine kinase PilS (NtrC family)
MDRDTPGRSAPVAEFVRLWRGFMTARVTVGAVLIALQAFLLSTGASLDPWLLLMSCGYFVASLMVRLLHPARRLGPNFDPQWALTVGVDLMVFIALQFFQGSTLNYALLLSLPVLLSGVLGNLSLSLGTAAGATLLLLAHATWWALHNHVDSAARFAQSALTGAGGFAIAFLASLLSNRLALEEKKSTRSLRAVRVQLQINELVIESLRDGVLVVDDQGNVHAANPAARTLLGGPALSAPVPWALGSEAGWQALLKLTELSFFRNGLAQTPASIHHAGQGPRQVQVRTRLTAPIGGSIERLCVMFLQDQREMEAQMRAAQLASMGRMSVAVAHEIRNPLAAIAQANALLEEDLTQPHQQQLTRMVQQNARRLEKIVEDILNVSRVKNKDLDGSQPTLALDESTRRVCRDWGQQNSDQGVLQLDLALPEVRVVFDSDHLRRVLVNLLDNARRYAAPSAGAIQVSTRSDPATPVMLGVWSNGAPLDQSVERHLFEPFFSSESRSSGLGLFICRELCEGHGATLRYQRCTRFMDGRRVEGNEFQLVLQRIDQST